MSFFTNNMSSFNGNRHMPTTSKLLTAYTSVTAGTGTMMIANTIYNKYYQLIPYKFRSYIHSSISYIIPSRVISLLNIFDPPPYLTLVINEFDGLTRNQVFEAADIYLRTRVTPSMDRLIISKAPRDKNLSVTFEKGGVITDDFEGIQLTWKCIEKANAKDPYRREKGSYELSFLMEHKDKVQECYLPYVMKKSKELKDENKVVKLHTYGGLGGGLNVGGVGGGDGHGSGVWGSINLEHPATFDTLAMDPELKKELIEDLERFCKRKEFYKRVGKAWKRGYLLYGPPGTGKSSLIAAMANYLNFDIYDLELANVSSNSGLRKLLLSTTNRSILVIEDIDCSVDFKDEEEKLEQLPRCYRGPDPKLTLSGLLNFIDGLWSSCGDERIIIFTTNHKDKLDPALLRPGRMDMHIHMSYCTPSGFRLLSSNYLSIHDNHHRFGEIDALMQETQITPAEVAEELMKSEDAEVSLDGLVRFMKRKRMEDELKDEGDKEGANQETKRQKVDAGEGTVPGNEDSTIQETKMQKVNAGERTVPRIPSYVGRPNTSRPPSMSVERANISRPPSMRICNWNGQFL